MNLVVHWRIISVGNMISIFLDFLDFFFFIFLNNKKEELCSSISIVGGGHFHQKVLQVSYVWYIAQGCSTAAELRVRPQGVWQDCAAMQNRTLCKQDCITTVRHSLASLSHLHSSKNGGGSKFEFQVCSRRRLNIYGSLYT